jgi:hypothetical protein
MYQNGTSFTHLTRNLVHKTNLEQEPVLRLREKNNVISAKALILIEYPSETYKNVSLQRQRCNNLESSMRMYLPNKKAIKYKEQYSHFVPFLQ